jgi:hypothetical protein
MPALLKLEEIKLWEIGYVFQDPWPKNIVKMVS